MNSERLWTVLDHQGRSIIWLAKATGYSETTVRWIKAGRMRPNADFRAKCAQLLGVPEEMLFAASDSARAS